MLGKSNSSGIWIKAMIIALITALPSWGVALANQLGRDWQYVWVLSVCAGVLATLGAWVVYGCLCRWRRQAEEQGVTLRKTVLCLSAAIDARDSLRSDRLLRIADLAAKLGSKCGLRPGEVEDLQLAAYLHDTGKLALPDHLLHKQGPLSEAERAAVAKHTEGGVKILRPADLPPSVLQGIYHHHERWDGRGYPDGLAGAQIPLAARILALADSYVSLRSERPFRQAWDRAAALEIMQEKSGEQFDPILVSELISMIDDPSEVPERDYEVSMKNSKRPEADTGLGVTEPDREMTQSILDSSRETTVLLRTIDALGKAVNTEEVLQSLMEVRHIATYGTMALFMLDPESGIISARFADGENVAAIQRLKIPYGHGVTGWAISNHRPMTIAHAELDFTPELHAVAVGYSSAAVFPWTPYMPGPEGEGSQGALTLYLKPGQTLSLEKQRRLQGLAARVGERMFQLGSLKRVAGATLSDAATNLPNLRYIYASTSQELCKARRYSYPVCIVEMEIENFKSLAEEYGKECLEKMVRELACKLRKQLRDSDVLARLSEAEFGAVLSMTSHPQALYLVRRLERAVEMFHFQAAPGRAAQVRASFGCAVFPDHGRHAEALFLHANRDRIMGQSSTARAQPRGVRPTKGNVIPFRF